MSRFRRFVYRASFSLLAAVLLCGCRQTIEISPYADIPKPTAVITMESGIEMTFTLDPACAPNTVSNFITLANSGYYDGLKVDYLYPTYFLRAGDPKGDGTGGPDYTIEGEFSGNGYKFNTLNHERGVISMCRLVNNNNSAGSQFFIMQSRRPEYDGEYAAFGYIEKNDTQSLNALNKLCSETVDKDYRPLVKQVIRSIRVDTKGYVYEVVKYGSDASEQNG